MACVLVAAAVSIFLLPAIPSAAAAATSACALLPGAARAAAADPSGAWAVPGAAPPGGWNLTNGQVFVTWGQVCAEPAFQSRAAGPLPTSFQFGSAAYLGNRTVEVSFALSWFASCSDSSSRGNCSWAETWTTWPQTDRVGSPVLTSYLPNVCACGAILVKGPAPWLSLLVPGLAGGSAAAAVVLFVWWRGRRGPPSPPTGV